MKSESRLRVVVVEDHPEFRESLVRALAPLPWVGEVKVCRDLPAGMAEVEHQCPDVLLVDLGLPSGSGLNLIRLAQVLWGDACCSSVLTVSGNEEYLLKAVRSGASGFVFKSDSPDHWVSTIEQQIRGMSPLTANVAQWFTRQIEQCSVSAQSALPEQCRSLLKWVGAGYTYEEAAEHLKLNVGALGEAARKVYEWFREPLPRLSPRELELIRYLGRGLAFKQCAERMGVSESTTKTQANRAYQKLGANNLQSALYEARQAGLLS